jgi:3-hydroxyisobutyrate dehydrogenase-like beta-hydroxyacid dehydrogenase
LTVAGALAVAVLGFGEAGSLLALDLLAAGADVRGFDPAVDPPGGVNPRSSEADSVRDAELVLSVNSAHDALRALTNARPALRAGTVWADLNTSSPGLKRQLAEVAAGSGAEVVDVALMAPVPGLGLRTPMVASGPAAGRFADHLAGLGVSVQVMAGPVGTASSRKLLRSVFYKGLAAAVIEALAGAREVGCEAWLRQSIAAELTRFDERTVDRLVDGSRRHARRRADEMSAAAGQLRELGVVPRVSDATTELLRQLAEEGAGPVTDRRSAPAP